MKVKELKKKLEKVDDDIDVEVSCPQWGSSITTVSAYLDKKCTPPLFCIEADNEGI